ncbi:MAG TPA: hypothetical protein GXZ97_09005 [Hydrogenispora sp.]|nr:hypothetical protein [Hydrogenispora sp.]
MKKEILAETKSQASPVASLAPKGGKCYNRYEIKMNNPKSASGQFFTAEEEHRGPESDS